MWQWVGRARDQHAASSVGIQPRRLADDRKFVIGERGIASGPQPGLRVSRSPDQGEIRPLRRRESPRAAMTISIPAAMASRHSPLRQGPPSVTRRCRSGSKRLSARLAVRSRSPRHTRSRTTSARATSPVSGTCCHASSDLRSRSIASYAGYRIRKRSLIRR
jgi:hypothetical protein